MQTTTRTASAKRKPNAALAGAIATATLNATKKPVTAKTVTVAPARGITKMAPTVKTTAKTSVAVKARAAKAAKPVVEYNAQTAAKAALKSLKGIRLNLTAQVGVLNEQGSASLGKKAQAEFTLVVNATLANLANIDVQIKALTKALKSMKAA